MPVPKRKRGRPPKGDAETNERPAANRSQTNRRREVKESSKNSVANAVTNSMKKDVFPIFQRMENMMESMMKTVAYSHKLIYRQQLEALEAKDLSSNHLQNEQKPTKIEENKESLHSNSEYEHLQRDLLGKEEMEGTFEQQEIFTPRSEQKFWRTPEVKYQSFINILIQKNYKVKGVHSDIYSDIH